MTDPIATVDAINAGMPNHLAVDVLSQEKGLEVGVTPTAEVAVGWDQQRFEALMSGSKPVNSSDSLSSLDVPTNQFVHHPLRAPEPNYLTQLMDVMGSLDKSKNESSESLKKLGETLTSELEGDKTTGVMTASEAADKSSDNRLLTMLKLQEHTSDFMANSAMSGYINSIVTAGVSAVKGIIKGQ